MAGLNRVQLIGRLGTDPETRITPGDRNVCAFRLAVDRRWRGADANVREVTDWFNIEAWGRLGEICQQYLTEGRLVFVEGRLQTDRYEQDGQIRYFTKVTAASMQMLDRRPGEDEAGPPEAADEALEEAVVAEG